MPPLVLPELGLPLLGPRGFCVAPIAREFFKPDEVELGIGKAGATRQELGEDEVGDSELY